MGGGPSSLPEDTLLGSKDSECVGILPELDEGNFRTLADPIEPIEVLAQDWEAELVRACRAGLVGMTKELIDPAPFPCPFALASAWEGALE